MIALLSLMLSLHADVVCPPMGCPDYESQRAAEIDDSLTYIQDSLDDVREAAETCWDSTTYASRACDAADSLRYVADSLRAIAGATVAADPMSSIATDPSAVAHSLALPAEPALVSVATRGNVSEPDRATTCYVGLDCPE